MVEPSVDIADRDPILTAAVGFETLEFLTRQMRAKRPEGFVLCAKRALESGYLALQTDNVTHDTPPASSHVSPLLALATAVFACAKAPSLVVAMFVSPTGAVRLRPSTRHATIGGFAVSHEAMLGAVGLSGNMYRAAECEIRRIGIAYWPAAEHGAGAGCKSRRPCRRRGWWR